MKSIIILLFMVGCWNDPEPEYCFKCQDNGIETIYCGYTEDEIIVISDSCEIMSK